MAGELNFDSYGFLDEVWDMNQSNWSDYFYPTIQDGVILGIGNEMLVYGDSSGMVVKVKTGECRVRSHRGSLTAEKSLTIEAASSANPRIDLIVARVNYLTKTVTIAVKKGTAASSPSAPSVTQSAGSTWEIPLAQVAVAKNATTIAANDVTDMRKRVRVGGWIKTFSSGTVTAVNDCELRRSSVIGSSSNEGLSITLPALDPPDVWMCSFCFSSGANFTGVSFTRSGEAYTPKAVGDSLNLLSKRYNLMIWWDGAYFWVAAKAL